VSTFMRSRATVRSGAIVLKKSLFGDARFIGALRSGIQKIAWGTSRFSA
jgi:hypothetical protein